MSSMIPQVPTEINAPPIRTATGPAAGRGAGVCTADTTSKRRGRTRAWVKSWYVRRRGVVPSPNTDGHVKAPREAKLRIVTRLGAWQV
ncbi:hypothetical protein PG994_014258 [Apiospora phragmitis]|uniref:Uncharacterized protein n=1 Tax=Apiospora phragmitis TaxID=2905665 RepID=A0ABR1T3T9_9PEZI